jgi:PAS domain S-box-containing protein
VPIEIVARRLEDGRIQVIARDISARERAEAALRESEARFRALFDADVMPICFWRADGRVTEANDAYLALTGFSRAALAAGALRWDERTAPEHRDRDAQALAEAAARGAWAPHEKDYVRRDGRRVPVLCGGAILPGHADRGVAFVIDLTERKRAEALLRELTARLLQAQDEERRRIARELHDVTAQDLFAQSLLLRHLAQPGARLDRRGRETVTAARALGEQALRDLRTQTYLLHPPLLDELGLAIALEWLVDGFARRSGIAVELAVDEAVGRLPEAIELALYRVAQEGLGNVHRHAGSAMARVALSRKGDAVILRVEDHGHGLPRTGGGDDTPAPTGVGLAGMRERLRPLGGHLALASSDRGTTLTAVVPLPHEAAR